MKAFFLLLLLFPLSLWAQPRPGVRISDDLEIVRLSEHVYVHVSQAELPGFGSVSSNGVIVVDRGEAILLDTPATEAQTETLVRWITDSLGVAITAFVPNHGHGDCLGGLESLHRIGVPSFAGRRTIDLARKYGLPVPQQAFDRRKVLRAGGLKIVCLYPGAAHSTDNIVVWIPSERMLFAGCMAKEMAAENLGNLADGDRDAYPATIEKVIRRFPRAAVVVPGHGQTGGMGLLHHTLDLAKVD